MTALPYVAVDHLYALDGQRLLLRTFLETRGMKVTSTFHFIG
jgi:hypothetical protein